MACRSCQKTQTQGAVFSPAQKKKPADQRLCKTCVDMFEKMTTTLRMASVPRYILGNAQLPAPNSTQIKLKSFFEGSMILYKLEIHFLFLEVDFTFELDMTEPDPNLPTVKNQFLGALGLSKDFPISFTRNGKPLTTADKRITWKGFGEGPTYVTIPELNFPASAFKLLDEDQRMILSSQIDKPLFLQMAQERVANNLKSKRVTYLDFVLLDFVIKNTSSEVAIGLLLQQAEVLYDLNAGHERILAHYYHAHQLDSDESFRSLIIQHKQEMYTKLSSDFWGVCDVVSVLSPELFAKHIFPHLSVHDVNRLSRVSHSLNNGFKFDFAWKALSRRYFPEHSVAVRSRSWKTLFQAYFAGPKALQPRASTKELPVLPVTFRSLPVPTDHYTSLALKIIETPADTTLAQAEAIFSKVPRSTINKEYFLWRFLSFRAEEKTFLQTRDWVNILLNCGADPNLCILDLSPLTFSLIQRWEDVAQLLIHSGASSQHPSIHAGLKFGHFPLLTWASVNDMRAVVALLSKELAPVHPDVIEALAKTNKPLAAFIEAEKDRATFV